MTNVEESNGSLRSPDVEEAIKRACCELLDRLSIPYEKTDHAYANTIEQCREIEKVLGCEICKNLLLTNRQMTDVYLLMLPGDKVFKTKFLSSQLGCSRLSFASAEQMLSLLNITPGSLSVLGLAYDRENKVRLVIDRELLTQESLGCHPCVNSSTLKLRTGDLLESFLPAVGHAPTFVDLPRDVETSPA